MVDFKKLIPTLCLLFSIILAVSSIFSPWWGIWNSKESQATTNNTKIVYYMPLQTVTARDVMANISLVLSFNNLAENDTNISALSTLFTSALGLAAAGMVLTIVALALGLVPLLRNRTFNFAWIIGIVGALIVFVSLLYVTANMSATLAMFANVLPPELGVVKGPQIGSFWGSSSSWVWGAGYGWLLLFVSALLCTIGSLLMRNIREKAE